jgi:hypothetical protein
MLHLERRSSPSTTAPIAAFLIALVMCLAFVLSTGDFDNSSVDPGSVRPMAAPVGLDQ